MEALEALLKELKQRECKTFEEASAHLDAVLKLRDAVVAFEKESLVKIVPATFAKTQQFVATAKSELKKLEENSKKVVSNLAKTATSFADEQRGAASGHMYFGRYAQAAEHIEKARTALAALELPPYDSVEEIKAFTIKTRAEIDKMDKEVFKNTVGKVIGDKIREVDQHGDHAKYMFNQYRNQDALDSIAKTREGMAQLAAGPFNTQPEVIAFLAKIGPQIDELEEKVGQKMYANIVEEKIRNAKTHASTAKQMHYQSRFQESLDAVTKARESIEELQSTFGTFKTVVEFLPAFITEIDEYEKKCGESMFGRLVDEKIRAAKTFGSTAKDMLFHNRYQESLDAIAKAREVIEELQSNFGTYQTVVEFLPGFIAQIDEYEKKCGEEMYGRIVDEKIRAAKTFGSTAKDMLFHNRYQESLDAIAKAREVIEELQSNFGTFKTVVEFLPGFIAQIDEYERKCGEEMYGRVVDEKIRTAESFGSTAKGMHYQSRFQEALEAVAKAREVIEELQSNFGTFKTVVAFLPAFITQIDTYENQCGEALFSKVVSEKIRAAESHAGTAKGMHYQSRFQEAVEAVAKAREVVEELKQAPYNSLKMTQDFLPAFENQLDQYERQCGEAMFGRVADDKIRAIESLVTNANYMHNQSRHEEASQSVGKAREAMVEIEEDPFRTLDVVVVYLKTAKPALDALEAKIGEAIFGRVVYDKMYESKTQLNTAKGLVAHSRHQEALEALTKAYETLQVLEEPPLNTYPLVVNYLAEARADIAAVEATVTSALGSKVSAAEGTSVVRSAVANAPGFPSGPIQSTIGPWVVHVTAPFTSVQAQPTTPAKTRSFVIQWNTTILTIKSEWKKAVNELIRLANNAESVPDPNVHVKSAFGISSPAMYHPPAYIAGQFEHTISLIEKFEKQVAELPDDEKDTLKKTMMEQIQTSKKNLAENVERESKVVQFVKELTKASELWLRISIEATKPRTTFQDLETFVDEIASELHSLNLRHPYLPPFQEPLEKLINEQARIAKVRKILDKTHNLIAGLKGDQAVHLQESIMEGLKELEKWPLAHRSAVFRLKKQWTSFFRFFPERWQPEYETVWPTATAPTDLWQPTEEDLGLPEYELIQPGNPEQTGLPFGNRPDLSTADKDFAANTLPFAGQFVFATEEISETIKNKGALKNKFSLTDQIYTRAIWPRSLENYPIGKNKDGSAAYTTDKLFARKDYTTIPGLLMILRAKLNGKEIVPKNSTYNAFGCYRNENNENMYAEHQSLRWTALGLNKELSSFFDRWSMLGRTLYAHLIAAGAGTHKVEMSLQYHIYDREPRHQNLIDGPGHFESLISHPLAEGSFEVDVPAGAKMPDTFGPADVEPVPFSAIRSRLGECLWAKQTDDWKIRINATEETKWDDFNKRMITTKYPAKWGKTYTCIGWKGPHEVFLADLTVVSGPEKSWAGGVEHIYIDTLGDMLDERVLPESLLAKKVFSA